MKNECQFCNGSIVLSGRDNRVGLSMKVECTGKHFIAATGYDCGGNEFELDLPISFCPVCGNNLSKKES